MTRSVDNIDFCIFIVDRSVFGKDRDSTFTFNIVRIHDTFCYFLIFTEYSALF